LFSTSFVLLLILEAFFMPEGELHIRHCFYEIKLKIALSSEKQERCYFQRNEMMMNSGINECGKGEAAEPQRKTSSGVHLINR